MYALYMSSYLTEMHEKYMEMRPETIAVNSLGRTVLNTVIMFMNRGRLRRWFRSREL